MKKFRFAFLLPIFLIFISAGGPTKKLSWLQGTWVGTGYQPNATTQSSWPIELTYDDGIKKVLIMYSSFPCGGYWELVKDEKERAEFIERIQKGTDKCVNNVKVIITKIDDTHISVAYYNISNAYNNESSIEAFGVLEKKGKE